MSVNKVILVGYLGQDPEVRSLESGIKMARFNLATSETFTDKINGEKRSHTEWHRIVVWRNLAEIAEKHLKKGDRIYLEGTLRGRTYQDKSGTEKAFVEIVGKELTFLGSSTPTKKTIENRNDPLNFETEENDMPF